MLEIRQKTTDKEIADYLKNEIRIIEKVLINVLNRVGLECVSEARNNGSYIDRTGNLRSSIGYAILRNGVVTNKSGFVETKDGKQGKGESELLIQEVASSFSNGLVLIVVAGMDYASYVATTRNVLQSSEILAERLVPTILMQLGFTSE